MGTPSPPLSPLLLAASRAHTWKDVLGVFTQCQRYLHGVYQPTTAELQYGLRHMSNSWSTALFYYNVVKAAAAPATPDANLVITVVRHFKEHGNGKALARVIEEDTNSATLDGAKARITLATFTGSWEVALATLMQQPKLQHNRAQRRAVLSALAAQQQWRLALQVLRMHPALEPHPTVLLHVMRCCGRLRLYDVVRRLAAAALAAGYTLDTTLLSGVLTTLRDTNQWHLALEAAQRLQLFSATRAEARRNVVLFNQLVDCLYEANLYGDYTMEGIVHDVLRRVNPHDELPEAGPRPAKKAAQFRLWLHPAVFQRFQGVLLPLSQLYSKVMQVPRWYSRSISGIVEATVKEHSTVVVMDTNFLLQLVQKNLPPEHFYTYMRAQYPELKAYHLAMIVIPFTVLQEAYMMIWTVKGKVPASIRSLLWSRVVAMVEKPNVYALSLASEYPCTSLGIIPKMAYSTMSSNLAGDFQHDPDLRILNVCVSLQHFFRAAEATKNLGGMPPVEGIALFSLLKYHVRRYCNTVKGFGTDRLLLCTMDRRMSQAALLLGIRVFPNLENAP